MVEREGSHRAVRGDAQPVLPDGRGASINLIEPARALVLPEHVLRDVLVPVLAEHVEQVRHGKEAGIEPIAVAAHHVGKAIGRGLALARGQHPEREGQDIRPLEVDREHALSLGVGAHERTAHVAGICAQLRCLVLLAEYVADVGKDVARVSEPARGHDVLGGHRALHGAPGHQARQHPIAVVERRVPQVARVAGLLAALGELPRRAAHAVVVPAAHGVVAATQHVDVAVLTVELPRHGDDRVAPARRRAHARHDGAAARRVGHRRVVEHLAVVGLVGHDLVKPARKERVEVHEEAAGRRIDLNVARPTHALALGTVGGNGEHVAALRPQRVLQQLVHARVGGADAARLGKVAADGEGDDARGVEDTLRGLVPAGDAHVT